MTGNQSLLSIFDEKYLGTDRLQCSLCLQFLGLWRFGFKKYYDQQGFYYVKGLNHNLFLGKRLIPVIRGTKLYTISLQETTSSTPIYLMAKASPTQAWLWHRRLSHLNFDYINLLSKKDVVIGLPKLKYTWTLFLRSKDETPEVLKDFLTMIQRNLQAPIQQFITTELDLLLPGPLYDEFNDGTISKNSSSVDRLHFRKECIDYRRIICFQLHSPWELSGFLSTLFAAPSPFPIYQWTYKRHILNVQLKEESVDSKKQDCTAKTSSEAEIRALICKLCLSHVDEDTTFKRIWLQLQQNNRCIANPPQSASINLCNPEQHSPYQAHPYSEVHQAAETVTTSNELDLLFGPLFDEYFNGENQVVLKSSAVTTTDASNKRQQQPDSTSSTSTLATTVTANGNFDL
ncbi:retrovirus-related pol polyprotein from transposon TNT 1-94 [Tanacetum coccineum]